MHADGLIAEISGSGTPTYHLNDALGSVRGLTNLSGTVTGASDFDVFGDVRTQTGSISIFDFTGEQRDSVTRMTYLRARYYEPEYGRFISADTVQPGGPGTQGYNRYVYVGNNPCTNTDPSGHEIIPPIAYCPALGAAAVLTLVRAILGLFPAPKDNWSATMQKWSLFAAALLGLLVVIVQCLDMAFSAVSNAGGPSLDGPPSLPSLDPPGPSLPFPPVPPLPGPNPDPSGPPLM